MFKSHFLKSHLFIPGLAFFIVLGIIYLFIVDLRLADILYSLEGQTWYFKDHWFTEAFLHKGGRQFSIILALLLLLTIGLSYKVSRLKPYRRGLYCVFITAICSALIISLFKSLTHIDCPWDLIRYGGFKPYIGFFGNYPTSLDYGQCFPAGHASAGYSWFGLYFFTKHYFYSYKNIGLAFPIILGLIFGVDQQLRGAHFLSHDLWTAFICWVIAVFLFWAFRFETTSKASTPHRKP